jgi:hypothetical protein
LIKVLKIFLGFEANADLVLKFHVAQYASHAALPMVILPLGGQHPGEHPGEKEAAVERQETPNEEVAIHTLRTCRNEGTA